MIADERRWSVLTDAVARPLVLTGTSDSPPDDEQVLGLRRVDVVSAPFDDDATVGGPDVEREVALERERLPVGVVGDVEQAAADADYFIGVADRTFSAAEAQAIHLLAHLGVRHLAQQLL